MLRLETVSASLLSIGQKIMAAPELSGFRLVGGTAIALQLGHRRSIDLDFFSNEKMDLPALRKSVATQFPGVEFFVSPDHLSGEVDGVKVEFYQDWHIPFRNPVIESEGLRLANLMDLAAFKLSAITGRREKKDYIDLYFLFQALGVEPILEQFAVYEPLMSKKSILFALTECHEAYRNQSIMPDMLVSVSWQAIQDVMRDAGKVALPLLKNR